MGFTSQELLKALISFVDVAGLYFALTQLTHRNISQNHKFQAVGLGEYKLTKLFHLNSNCISKFQFVKPNATFSISSG